MSNEEAEPHLHDDKLRFIPAWNIVNCIKLAGPAFKEQHKREYDEALAILKEFDVNEVDVKGLKWMRDINRMPWIGGRHE